MKHVFISYVRSDSEVVMRLAKELRRRGIDVWLDKDKLTPGTRWQPAIREAIRSGAAFIACFSPASLAKDRSYANEELVLAIEELRRRPAERQWFIPVQLGPDTIPDRSIGAGETLRDFQRVDLYDNWEESVERLSASILSMDRKLISKRGVNYAQLSRFLEDQRWQEAEIETADRFVELNSDNALSAADIQQLPAEDLQIIDDLWTSASGGRFGFSVQARIYLELDDLKTERSDEKRLQIQNQFMERIGWGEYGQSVFREGKVYLIYRLEAPAGHLPGALIPVKLNLEGGEYAISGLYGMGFLLPHFMGRIISCLRL